MFVIVPIISLPIFIPAFIIFTSVISGDSRFSSYNAEAIDILTSIQAPNAPIIIPANNIPLKSIIEASITLTNSLASSHTPESCIRFPNMIANKPAIIIPQDVPIIAASAFLLNPAIITKLITVIIIEIIVEINKGFVPFIISGITILNTASTVIIKLINALTPFTPAYYNYCTSI